MSVAAALPQSVGPYVALMVAGFVVAIWGQGMHSKWTAAVGIIMIFLASLLLPLALHVFSDGNSAGPDRESRSRDLQSPAPLQQP